MTTLPHWHHHFHMNHPRCLPDIFINLGSIYDVTKNKIIIIEALNALQCLNNVCLQPIVVFADCNSS